MPTSAATTLTNAGDAVPVILTNDALGQDGAATLSVAPGPSGFSNVTIAVEKAATAADYAANNWQPPAMVSRTVPSGGVSLPSGLDTLASGAGGTALYSVVGLGGAYALRVRLPSQPARGSVVVEITTFPVINVSNMASLGLLQVLATLNAAQTLAFEDMNGSDYLAAVGGSL